MGFSFKDDDKCGDAQEIVTQRALRKESHFSLSDSSVVPPSE